MKKIFLFAAAAVTMAAGCQKLQEILVNPNDNPVDENGLVEIKFTTNVATVETKTRTKSEGALTALTPNQTLYIYGLNKSNPTLRPITNVAATTTVAQNAAAAAINWVDDSKVFFYNGTSDRYEFYGYYVDDAVAKPEPSADTYQLNVAINGQQDLLLAKADPATDCTTAGAIYSAESKEITVGSGDKAKTYPVYSAGSARNGVTPNLAFKHALSQFTFHVRNLGTKSVTLKGVSLRTPNEATLTVAGDNQGLTVADDADLVNLVLPMTDKTLTPVEDPTEQQPGYTSIENASIMAFPEQAYTVVLYLDQVGIEDGKVRTVSVPVKVTDDAQPGLSYKVQITIYSLEEVELTATLAQWVDGANQVIDSEDNFGEDFGPVEGEGNWQPEEELTATLTENTSTSQTYTFSIPAEVNANGNYTRYVDVEAALVEGTPTDGDWKPVVTKASEYKVKFTNLDNEKTYMLHVRYKKETKFVGQSEYTKDSDYTPSAPQEAHPFAITEVYFVEENETSYNQLPVTYREEYGDWKKYLADKEYAATHDDDLAKRFIALPWIAVECSASPEYLEIEVQKGGSAFGDKISWPGTTGLFTIAASELGVSAFEDGTYKVIANGATSADLTIDVDPKQPKQ